MEGEFTGSISGAKVEEHEAQNPTFAVIGGDAEIEEDPYWKQRYGALLCQVIYFLFMMNT